MATKKILRTDLIIESLRSSLYSADSCKNCPVSSYCHRGDDISSRLLCNKGRAEDFKQAVIDRFSTDVEVESEG